MFNFTKLDGKLPAESITWAGFGQPLIINANNLTGDEITPDSGALETLGKMLEALHKVQTDMNAEREQLGQEPIVVIEKSSTYNEETNRAAFVYTLALELDTEQALNNVVDPTA